MLRCERAPFSASTGMITDRMAKGEINSDPLSDRLKEAWTYLRKHKWIPTVVIVIIIVSSCVIYLYDKNGNSLDFSDTEVMVVVTGSMDGDPRNEYEICSIPIGSLIFVSHVPQDPVQAQNFYASLSVGDVLTFHHTNPATYEDMVVTHRIVSIADDPNGYVFTLQGDAIADDPTNSSVQVVDSWSGDVVGKVTGVSPLLGDLVVFLSGWTGKVVLIIIPCLILVASEVVSIVRNLRKARETGASEPENVPSSSDCIDDPLSDDKLFRRKR